MKKGDVLKELFDDLIEKDEAFCGLIESIEQIVKYKGRTIKLTVSFDEDEE